MDIQRNQKRKQGKTIKENKERKTWKEVNGSKRNERGASKRRNITDMKIK
jgi:hypothetical protein